MWTLHRANPHLDLILRNHRLYICSKQYKAPLEGVMAKQRAEAVQIQRIFQSLEFGAKSQRLLSVPVYFCTVLCRNALIENHPESTKKFFLEDQIGLAKLWISDFNWVTIRWRFCTFLWNLQFWVLYLLWFVL